MPAASISFTRFQHGVLTGPRPWRAAARSGGSRAAVRSSSARSWRSSDSFLNSAVDRRTTFSAKLADTRGERSTFSPARRFGLCSLRPIAMPPPSPAPTTSSPTTSAARTRRRLPDRHPGADPAAADAARSATPPRGLDTHGFISGYRGSPLGMVDQQAWKAAKLLDAAGVRFLPAINEELGATAVLGTQRVESDPERTADGVFAMWYGKGPGVDRAGDALKHGNAYGSSPHGGVLVVAGDDHGCVSSSMPHQSDATMQSWHMPVRGAGQRRRVPRVRPLRLGAVALLRQLGRLHGAVGSGGERLDGRSRRRPTRASPPGERGRRRRAATGFVPPAGGLHYRWPDLPSLTIEAAPARQARRGAGVRARQRIDRHVVVAPTRHGRHRHLRQGALRPARGLPPARHPARGAGRGRRAPLQGRPVAIRSSRRACDASPTGLDEILVIEEKGAVVEAAAARPVLQRAPCGRRSSASATRAAGRWSPSWASCGRRG